MKPILNITRERFAKYGQVLMPCEDLPKPFEIIVREEGYGWRLAVLTLTGRDIDLLENHPTSFESFQPISGASLLIVAPNEAPEDFEVFLLDKPICLNKGIWHNNIALSESACIQIAENLDVESEYYHLKTRLAPTL